MLTSRNETSLERTNFASPSCLVLRYIEVLFRGPFSYILLLLWAKNIVIPRTFCSLLVAVFSRRRMSRLTFQKVFCLQTKLSDLKLIGVFTSKIITFHFGNLRRARANKSISIIWRETEKMVACTSYFFSLLCLCGWLSSDGGADFNKGCDCSQLEAG